MLKSRKFRKKLSYKNQDSFIRSCSWLLCFYFFVVFAVFLFQESFSVSLCLFSGITFSHFFTPPFIVFLVCFVSLFILFLLLHKSTSSFILSTNRYIIGNRPNVLKRKIQMNRQISFCCPDLYKAIHFHVISQATRNARNGNTDFNIKIFGIKSILISMNKIK